MGFEVLPPSLEVWTEGWGGCCHGDGTLSPLLADAPTTLVLFYCHVMDRSLHIALPTSQTLSPAIPSSRLVRSESFLLQTSELGAVILRVAWGGGRWRDFFTLPPPLFCLSGTDAWSCYPAGWFSGHRGDNARGSWDGVCCACLYWKGVLSRRVREEVERKVALSKEWIVAAA